MNMNNTYPTNTGNCIGVARKKPINLLGLRFSSPQTASVRVCNKKWLHKTSSKIILAPTLQNKVLKTFKCDLS